MADDTNAHDTNGLFHGMVSGSNSFPLNETLAPLMNNHDFSTPDDDPSTAHQLWPITAEHFAFQYPLSTVDTDEVFCATDQWLQHDPDYRPPNQNGDVLLSVHEAPIEVRLRWGKSREINERSIPIPLPPTAGPRELPLYQFFEANPHDRSDKSGQYVPLNQQELYGLQLPRPQNAPLECQIAVSDGFYEAPQDGTFPQIAPSHQNIVDIRHNLGGDVPPSPASTLPAPKTQRCFECCFAHKPCTNSIPGSRCDRCTRMHNKLRAGLKHSKRLNDASSLFVDFVVFFDMRSTQNLLTRLRAAAEAITNLRPGVTLEDYFKGSIVCHMDNRIIPNSVFSVTAVPVVVKYLATTRTALALAESLNQPFPVPGLDNIQIDSFIDGSNRMHNLQELHQSEQAIIITACRCSDYIGILFNWDLNTICFENINSIPQAKNLVLETVYAMAYRVQQLLMILCHEVNQSLLGNYGQDPATISCALRIAYQSITCYRKLEWRAGCLQDLRTFLNGLHDRAPVALKALERYRVNIALLRCGEKSRNVKAFQALIDAKKTPKRAISFTYPHYRPDDTFLRLPNRFFQQTYTEVLETRIVNWDTFEFRPFTPSDFDQVEHQTFKNSEMSHTEGLSSNFSLAGLPERDKTSTARAYAGSVTSASCEYGSVSDAGGEHGQDITMPSLTINKTLPEESDASNDAEIQRTEIWLDDLNDLKSTQYHLMYDADTHEDWVGFVEPQGPPIDVENQSQASKMLSKMKEMGSPSITSAPDVGLEKQRQHQNTSPPLLGVQTSSDLPDPPSPASKRVHTGEPTLDPVILSRINHEVDLFSQPDISFGWDHEFNYELYEATN